MHCRDLRSLRHRLRRALLVSFASLLGGALAIIAMNAVDTAPPPPLWTEADLVELPPAASNGWLDATRTQGEGVSRLANVAAAMSAVLDGERTLEEARGELVVGEMSNAQTRYREACRAAFGKPRYVDACPIADGSCSVLNGYRCQNEILHEALSALAKGEVELATISTETLLQAHRDHLLSARSLISHLVALAETERALRLTQLIVARNPALAARLRPSVAQLPELGDTPNALKGEYLRVLQYVEAEPRGVHRFFLDPGETAALLAATFRGARTAPRRSEIGWWIDNPAGDYLLDLVAQDVWAHAAPRERAYEEARIAATLATLPRPR